MKRIIILALAALLLLSGCSRKPEPTPSEELPSPSASVEPSPSPSPETPERSIMDGRTAQDDSGELWYIPNATVETYSYPSVKRMEGGLLFSTLDVPESGENGRLLLLLLDIATGETIAEEALPMDGYSAIQVRGDRLFLVNSEKGEVLVLDSDFNTETKYTLEPGVGSWYVCYDMDTLIMQSPDGGLTALSLNGGSRRELLPDAADVSISGENDDWVCVSYVNKTTQLAEKALLDLRTRELAYAPFDGDFNMLYRSGDTWVGSLYGDYSTYYVGTDNASGVVRRDTGLSLLSPMGHILTSGGTDEPITLYTGDGDFISSIKLSDGSVGYMGVDIIWSEEHGGYFFAATDMSGTARLMFWDISAGGTGEPLEMEPLPDSTVIPGGETADASLYERAAELGEEFGVDIRVADQCGTVFSTFTATQISDYDTVSWGLDILEEALRSYPDGFFRQLRYGHSRSVRIDIVNDLQAINGFGDGGEYAAFTNEENGYVQVIMDMDTACAQHYYHEFSHIIDRKLAFDAELRDGALFSEEEWLALCPEGFEYTNDYSTRRDMQEGDAEYFFDGYSQISPTEDRARVMEFAMLNSSWAFENSPGLQRKLDYYSRCIRDCFNTDGWPDVTQWEQLQYNTQR